MADKGFPPETPHFTNQEHNSMQGQLLYKLAAMESALTSGFRRLDEKMDRFQSDLHEQQLATNDRINALDKETTERFKVKRDRITAQDAKITKLETWQEVAYAKVSAIVSAVTLIWVFLAPTIRSILGIANN